MESPPSSLSSEWLQSQLPDYKKASYIWTPIHTKLSVLLLLINSINNLSFVDDPTLMAECEEELKSLLMKVKEESEKVDFKLNIQKTKIAASCPITSWQIEGEKWKQCQILFSWAPKSLQTVTGLTKLKDTCSLEEKTMTNLDSVLKSRDITLPTIVHIVKDIVFSKSHVQMWESDHKESWALKNWCFQTGSGEDSWEPLGL